MTPVRSPTPVYVDMPTFNLTPDEEMLFLGRPLQTGSPVELMSLLDRPRPNQTVPSPLTAPQTTTAPVPVPDVLVQPAAVQATSQTTQPLPVTITPSSLMQAYFTATPQPATVQATSQTTQPLPVTIAPSSLMHISQAYFTATQHCHSQKTQPLPVTISPSSLWQPYLTETVAPQPTALQSTTQLAQQIPVPINPSTMEKDDIPTSDHSRVLEAPSSPPPNVEGYDPERPWMDGDKRRVEFREEIDFYPLEEFR
ncbi:unnamed protein product [Mytilus edulis]|uniref:Uncharacterized protein n=1 Tax=Mytilus edulis TaxID=6550 RepID=A0A8S3S7I3_MYTED|nr:unnamed protein product [Mytilus edulis]